MPSSSATSRAESSTRVHWPSRVARHEAAADREGRRAQHGAAIDEGELGGAAADIDMKDALSALARQLHRARAVRGEAAFEHMAGGGADEFPRLLGE